MDDQLTLALNVSEQLRMESEQLRTGYDESKKTWELIVKYSGDLTRLSGDEVVVEDLIAGYAIVTLPELLIPAFSQLEEVEYIEKPKRIFPQVQTALRVSCFPEQGLGNEQESGLTGEGVYIGVIDSGVDVTISVLRNTDGTTKIEYLWDQQKQADVSRGEQPPEGFNVGVEYTKEQIDKALQEATAQTISDDVTGHGSKVATIAAQGAGGSTFVIVKLDVTNQMSYPSTTSLMRAFTYIVRKARDMGRPVAINLSYGNTYGSHDGTSLLERFIDDISEVGKTVICVGSGNEGASAGHFSAQITENQVVEFAIGNYESAFSLQIWKHYADQMEIAIVSPGGQRYNILQNRLEGETQEVVLEQTRVLIFDGKPQPYRVKEEIYLDFIPLNLDSVAVGYVNQGVWEIEFRPLKVVNGNVQIYMPSEAIRSSGTRFFLPTPNATLTIPSTAEKVITVGAYQAYYGAYADFSGRGFVMNATDISEGLTKPDLVAPGVGLRVIGRFGEETVSGTSYATPIVTAACALLMEWGIIRGNDPYLYGERVKAYLIRGARQLAGYEEWPNAMVGWGALCVRDSIPS